MEIPFVAFLLLIIICSIFGFIDYIDLKLDQTREGVWYVYYTINKKRKSIRLKR